MKTILKIIVILLVAGIVAGGIYALVENTTLFSGIVSGDRQPPVMQNADGQSIQPMERPENGGEDGASLSRGFPGMLASLAKIAVITLLVVLLPRAFSMLGNHRLKPNHR